MSFNYSWYQQGYKDYYLPTEVVAKDPTILKRLNEECTSVVTKDNRKIYILRKSNLPDFIKPTFEHVQEYDFETFKMMVEKVNRDNHFPIKSLSPDLLRYIGSYAGKSTMTSASYASKGTKENMNLLQPKLSKDSDFAVDAAREGNLELLKWAKTNNAKWQVIEIAKAAVQGGHTKILDWILHDDKNRILFTKTAVYDLADLAAQHNRVDILNWLENNFSIIPISEEDILDFVHIAMPAFEMNHLDVIKFLIKKCPDSFLKMGTLRTLYEFAAGFGRVEFLEYFRAIRLPEPSNYLAEAAYKGKVEVLNWAYERNPESIKSLFLRVASGNGHLNVLEWALNKNIPLDNRVLLSCIRLNHIEVLNWAKEKNLPLPTNQEITAELVDCLGIMAPPSTNIADWLLKNNLLDVEILKTGLFKDAELLKWAIENQLLENLDKALDDIRTQAVTEQKQKVVSWIDEFRRNYSKEKL